MFYPQENRGATVQSVKVRTPLATKGENALAHAQTQSLALLILNRWVGIW